MILYFIQEGIVSEGQEKSHGKETKDLRYFNYSKSISLLILWPSRR